LHPLGTVHARLSAHGLFGWLAFGLENPGGGHNGMDGAHIVLALPGTDYSPTTGLDLTGGPTVHEYVINEEGGSAFRLWSEPYQPAALRASGVEANDCFTAMTFSSDALAGWPLPAHGNSTYIWGMSNSDAYVSYHGSSNRGKEVIDWSVGAVAGLEPGAPCDAAAHADDNGGCAPPLTCGCEAAATRSRALLFGSLPALECTCR
jgi:hypothetical protein